MAYELPAKAPTIKDVAREAGVSFKTVSRVINNNASVNAEMREAVEAAMRTLNYHPHQAARALRSRRSYSIALLSGWPVDPPSLFSRNVSSGPHFSEFFGELTMGCGVACRGSGYHMVFDFLAYGDQARAIKDVNALLDNLRPDGVLLSPPLCDFEWLLDILEQRMVRYGRLYPGTALDRGLTFGIDDVGAALKLTEMLLQAGHRNLAMITGPADHLAANERRRGFEAALAAVPGASFTTRQGNFMIGAGEQAALELLQSQQPPTAIFAANDSMAAGVIAVAAKLGIKVPDELSVTGFDDTLIASMTSPPLTTVNQPTFWMAREATEHLIRAANAGEPVKGEFVKLDYSITERQTIASPPAAPSTSA